MPQPQSPDPGFQAPSPDAMSNSPLTPRGSNLKRNLLIGAVFLALVGGGVYYFVEEEGWDDDYYDEDYWNEVYEYEDNYDYDYDWDEDWDSYEIYTSEQFGYMTYEHYDEGFRIDFPDDWEPDTEDFLVHVAFYSPFDGDFDDLFAENVNVTTEDLSWYGSITPEEYGESALEQVMIALPEYVLVEQGSIDVGSYRGDFLKGSYSIEGIDIEILSIFTLVGEKAYVITYTYEPEDEPQYRDVLDRMLRSFEVL